MRDVMPRRGGRNARRKSRLNKIEPMLPTLKRGIPLVEPMNPIYAMVTVCTWTGGW